MKLREFPLLADQNIHADVVGLLKVGYTEWIAADRIAEQFPATGNGKWTARTK